MKKKLIFAAAFLGLMVMLGLKSETDLDFARHPEASIDLATREGVQLVKSQGRYSDTRIVETDFQAAGADGQPSTTPVKTYDFTPHAGGAEFDDSSWQAIDPTTLNKRRGTGRWASTGTGSRSRSLTESAILIPPARPRFSKPHWMTTPRSGSTGS